MGDDLFPDSFGEELTETTLELERIRDLAQGVARTISSGFRGALLEGRSLQTMLGDIARSFADIALKAAIKPLGDLAGGLVEGLFTATNPALGGAGTPAGGLLQMLLQTNTPAIGGKTTLADGLVQTLSKATGPLEGGAVKAFAKGGVIAQPSYFPLGTGLGLAGEAGPEAIMPLARGSDGRLGVASGGGGSVQVTFNVTASDARSFVASEAEVSAMLLRAVRRGTRSS